MKLDTLDRQTLCTGVGAALAASGLLVALLSGADLIAAYAWAILSVVVQALAFVGASIAAVAGVIAVIWLLTTKLLRVAAMLALALFAIVVLLFVLHVAIVGWTRILGYEVYGLAGLGTIPFGVGCLALAAGCMAIAWCRMPLLESKDGPSAEGKVFATLAVAGLMVISPRLVVGLSPMSMVFGHVSVPTTTNGGHLERSGASGLPAN